MKSNCNYSTVRKPTNQVQIQKILSKELDLFTEITAMKQYFQTSKK